MSNLAFRNIDASPGNPVDSWPYEGLVAAMERGYLSDWRRIARAVRLAPWGETARSILDYSEYGEASSTSLLVEAVKRAREAAEKAELEQVAQRVRQAIGRSGLSARRFALECGTSSGRLSNYSTGKVVPSAAMLMRIEVVSSRLAPSAG